MSTTTRNPSKRSSPLTRDEVVDAARELLVADGLEELSLRRLASRVGVTAPALYAHVQDKQDLLAAIAQQGFETLADAFERVEDAEPLGRVRGNLRAYVEVALADPEVFRVMFRFRAGDVPFSQVDNELPAATTAFARSAQAVRDAIDSGDIHPERDPLLTAMTLWTAGHGLASVLLLGAQGGQALMFDNAEELIDDVISVTIAGLATPPTSTSPVL